MEFEDHFSHLASEYSLYRPGYPPELFGHLSGLCKSHSLAWDCGTGNGQAAIELASFFEKVYATDASKEQIARAPLHPGITFRVEPAEEVSLRDSSVDLVTVAVAVHWFDFEKFYAEVKRVLKPDGIIAVWTYQLPSVTPPVEAVVRKYYSGVLKDYWPDRFQYVDNCYRDLPFPFAELEAPGLKMETLWDMEQLAGFLGSWSAVKNYLAVKGVHPLSGIWEELEAAWGEKTFKYSLSWPLHIRIGRNSPGP